MTRKTRKTIFYVLVGAFFLIGLTVILYADGWRFDFASWRAEKVGAIFVRSFPGDARISLNNKPTANQSSFLSAGTLLSGLFPRTYALTLTENGYADWHENVAVLPSLVTELKYAVLVPQTPNAITSTTAANFFTAAGETVVQTTGGAIVWRGKTIGHGALVSESADFKTIIMQNTATGAYLFYDFGESATLNLSALLPKPISSIAIDPHDATKVIAGAEGRIFIIDTTQAPIRATSIERLPAGEALGSSLASSPSFLAWTRFTTKSNVSAVVLYDKFAKTATVGSSTLPGRNLELKWINDHLLGALEDNGSLYSYDTGTRVVQKIADDVKEFEPADDGSAVAALENRSLEIIPFTDVQTYHRFNLPDVVNAMDLIWYKDMDHLFVVYPDRVAFLDIEDLGLRNFITVAEGTSPLYKPQENIFYLINSAQKVVGFDFPS